VFIGKPLQEHYIHPYESNITVRLTEATEDLAIKGLDAVFLADGYTGATNKLEPFTQLAALAAVTKEHRHRGRLGRPQFRQGGASAAGEAVRKRRGVPRSREAAVGQLGGRCARVRQAGRGASCAGQSASLRPARAAPSETANE
jgi:hypothetical protein